MALLEVKDLHTTFFTPAGQVQAVNGLSFSLEEGKVLGIVGESGSGKSVTAYSILQILTHPGRIVSGSIRYRGEELVGASAARMNQLRGNKISIIFQDPMTSLNPVLTVGQQLAEAIRLHTGRNREQARQRAVEMLQLVGVTDPARRVDRYPYEFSGGMRQRVMIAMALCCEPDILIADEPTTALDVTIQAQILDLIRDLQRRMGMAVLLITHDLGVVAQMCDEVIVMYAGQVCERGTAPEIFYHPSHEYTKGLLRSVPTAEGGRLIPIGGGAVDLLNLPPGCPFAPRCPETMRVCLTHKAKALWVNEQHISYCWRTVREALARGQVSAKEIEELHRYEG